MFGRRRGGEAAGTVRRVVALDPDRSLVREAQADPARFDALYRKYVAQVYSFALHELRDHHEAEDVTERTFLLALGALPRFREEAPADAGPEASTFRVWLFRIARNVVANQRRTLRRRPTAPLEAAATAAAPDDVERGIVAPRRGLRCLGGRRPPPRRPAAGRRPALRRGDEHGRDRRRSSAAPRAPSGCSSTGRCAPSPATSRSGEGADDGPGAPMTAPGLPGVPGSHGAPGSLETLEVEALVTDRYLEGLLAAAERRAADAPADASLDPTLRAAALRLRDELVRVHPSFRFEDRLARRLAEAASAMRLAAVAGGETALVPFPRPFLADPALARELADPELAALVGVDGPD